MDETKIIAAILCAQTIVLEDVASDPIGKTVDFYERILAELRARGYGGPASDASPLQGPPDRSPPTSAAARHRAGG